MAIGKALIAKVLGGLAVVGAGGISYKEFNDHNYTRYDWGLIEYLNAGGKIKFAVKNTTTQGSEADLSASNFPNFTDSSSTPKTVSVKVSINTSSSGTNTGTLTDNGSEKGTKAHLQSLNGDGSGTGTAWTWICELKFTKEPSDESTNTLDETQKEALIKNSSEGLFNKLKDENGDENLKIKFIKNCASERGGAMALFSKGWNNRKINKLTNLEQKDGLITTANELKSEKTFVLVKGGEGKSWGTDSSKLYFKDKSEFDTWFK